MGVDIMSTVLQGLRESRDRTVAIRAARDKKRQADETFELNKQIKELNIEKLKMFGQLDEAAADLELKKINQQKKMFDAQSTLFDSWFDEGLKKESDAQGAMTNVIKKELFSILPYRETQYVPGQGFKSYVRRPARQTAVTKQSTSSRPGTADLTLGVLDQGGIYDTQSGDVVPFDDRSEAEAYAAQKLGYGWQEKYPEAVGILDKKFGVSLPEGLTKTSEAVEYLINEKGMTKQDAIGWIRKNQDKTIKIK